MDKNATHKNTGSIVKQCREKDTKHSVQIDRGRSTSDSAGNTTLDNIKTRETNDKNVKDIHAHSKTNTQTDTQTDTDNKKHERITNVETVENNEIIHKSGTQRKRVNKKALETPFRQRNLLTI